MTNWLHATHISTMLTRIPYRRDFRVFSRCFSDKPPSDSEPAPPASKPNKDGKKKQSVSESIMQTQKIQSLLKNMMMESKQKENSGKEKFMPIPDRATRRKQQSDVIEAKTEKIEESLTQAAGQVAEAIGGDKKQTEAELLSKVLGKINQTSTSLSDLLLGMKVDRSKDPEERSQTETRGQEVKRIVSRLRPAREGNQYQTRYSDRNTRTQFKQREPRSAHQVTHVDVYSGEPLGIFKSTVSSRGPPLAVWDSLSARELALATAQPPANYFQKMALWTRQGKVWKFPIDNEQGLEEEQSVHFSEHIFLETHLEGWCPKKGPIRHFMELVCVGLSKNPFYTVQEKRDHIAWYREYFESKKDVLSEVGAWDDVSKGGEQATL